jgi:hypothetical protein
MKTIRTEDLDTIDFSDVTTGNAIRPIHPGEILREESSRICCAYLSWG